MKPLPETTDPLPKARPSRLGRVVRIVVCVALVVAAILMVRRIDLRALGQAVSQASPWGLALAMALSLGQLACRGLAFRVLLLPTLPVSRLRAIRYMLAGSATSSVAPGRAGDLLRVYLLRRDGGVPVSSTAATLVVEKIIDITAMFLVLGPTPWLLPNLPPWVGRSMAVLALVAIGLLAAVWFLATRKHPPRWFASFHAGLRAVQRPALFLRALLPVLASWLLDFLCIWVILRAVGITIPATSGLLVLLTVNLALAVPAMPANLGTFELGVLAVLAPLGVPTELGLAFALLYHLSQILPVLLLALLDGRFVAAAASASKVESAKS